MSRVFETIMQQNPAPDAYRISYLANHFIGPITVMLKKQWQLTRTEFNIIFSLYHAPALNARDICEVTGRPKNSISRAVHSLAKKDYITTTPDPNDGRSVILALTPAGERLYDEFVPLLAEREQRILTSLSDEERACLDQILTKLIVNSEPWADVY